MTSDRRSLRAVAEARVEEALAAIREARRALAVGEQKLSGVSGFVYERKRLERLTSQVLLAASNLEDRREYLRSKGRLWLSDWSASQEKEPDDAED
jgi:hypothetical protein